MYFNLFNDRVASSIILYNGIFFSFHLFVCFFGKVDLMYF